MTHISFMAVYYTEMASDNGLLVLDKPGGITSRAALDRAAHWFPRGTKLGHAGTLDPLATGVLVLCVGSATRLVEYVQDMNKTYHSDFFLGATSDTDDADGRIAPTESPPLPDRDAIVQALGQFTGTIQQRPPAYSAARVGGRRAHELARKGREVSLRPRSVHVYRIELLGYSYPILTVEVQCGKGTYIRSLARDLGAVLRCGALVQVLRRTQIGPFRADAAVHLDTDPPTARACLQPLTTAVAELRQLTFTSDEIRRLRLGQALPWQHHETQQMEKAAVLSETSELIAIVQADPVSKLWRPEKVFVA